MRRFASFCLIFVCLVSSLNARRGPAGSCGTTAQTSNERRFLHRQAVRGRAGVRLMATPASTNRDIGDIAVIDDANGVVSRHNEFNLDGKTVAFTPSTADAAKYRYALADGGYDEAATSAGSPVAGLDDDDSRSFNLPFAFPYFGATHNRVFVNSDGNLTFVEGDGASADRSVGRMAAGAPRIAPLFADLDPSRVPGGVRVLSEANRFIVSWVAVPEYSDSGQGQPATFQVTLHHDGRIQFSYKGINAQIESAVVGIAPGRIQGSTTIVSFVFDQSNEYSAAVVELFASAQSIDVVAVAQKFYETHEDAYDYLVIYNSIGIQPIPGSTTIAYESTVRSSGNGWGVEPGDYGAEYGSPARLRAVMNMGPLSQYGSDPHAQTLRPGDTPLSILAHEAGHLFLAFASVADPNDPASRPMMGYQGAHWSFLFNSNASFLEGEEIIDRGPGSSPRFQTNRIVQRYAPLDQYLMGFRGPSEVESTFYVAKPNPGYSATGHPPTRSVSFDGERRDVTIEDLVLTGGRRTPDATVAQRRYRFAFILIARQGEDPSASDLAKLEAFRAAFPAYFGERSDYNGSAESSLKRSMTFSLFPAAGVVVSSSATATLTLRTAPSEDLMVSLQAAAGAVELPSSVTFAAGAKTASFSIKGLSPGVAEITATPPPGSPYETAFGKLQIADASGLKMVLVSGDNQTAGGTGPLPEPVIVRITDVNELPYVGARVVASSSDGGAVDAPERLTDAQGRTSFRWTPGAAPVSQLRVELAGASGVGVTLSAGSAAPSLADVNNAASFVSGLAAGSFGTVWGTNMAGGHNEPATPDWPVNVHGVQVLLNGVPLRLLYISDTQINFLVPENAALGAGTLTVVTPSGARTARAVDVKAVDPGIFPRAILRANTSERADEDAVTAGEHIEIYCNGLGPTIMSGGLPWTINTPVVFIGSAKAEVAYSGLSGYVGLYQVNVRIPAGLAPGMQPVKLSIGQLQSNTETIAVR